MCGTPERNLASTLSKMMTSASGMLQEYEELSLSNQELLRGEQRMKEIASEARRARKERAILNKGELNATSAGNGIDATSKTVAHLKHKEEMDKLRDIENIDKELIEGLRQSVAQRSKNSRRMNSSIFNSVTGSLFSLFR